MGNATLYRSVQNVRATAAAAVAANELRQLASGLAGAVADPTQSYAAGDRVDFATDGSWICPKDSSINLLDGGRAYWDYTNSRITFKKTGSQRDFYAGRVVGDALINTSSCTVQLNTNPADDYDLARDPYYTVSVGTQALGGFLPTQRRGGALKLLLSSTNEAQKTDALGKAPGWSAAAPAIVEMAIEVVSLGAGTAPDFNFGIASTTNATDADAIAQHLFCHIDGNSNKLNFQSKDGTHTTTAQDSGQTLTAGTRFEIWFDLRTPSAVKLYVNGVQVLSATTFDVSAGAQAWLLLAHLEKTAAADTFEADIDWLRARLMKL